MERATTHSMFGKSPSLRNKWFKEWVPQELAASRGKCSLFKWVTEDTLKVLEEECKWKEEEEAKPEPTTEVLFLCSYEGCGKTFIDAGAIKKHAHVHGERQYVCHYEGCGKKFVDSSKLKRHFLIHTGEKDYICSYEGCGKAFSLDFNLRAHMRTHSLENYHVCPYQECGKRYTHECKLRSHIKAHHEKSTVIETIKHTPPSEKQHNLSKGTPSVYGSASSDRPYACPYEGCGKAYIHEYKLNLHLRREHPGHNAEESSSKQQLQDEASDQDARTTSRVGAGKNPKRSKPNPSPIQRVVLAPQPAKVSHQKGGLSSATTNLGPIKKQWPPVKEMFDDDDDSEETEEDGGNVEEDGWRYHEANEDDEETEDED